MQILPILFTYDDVKTIYPNINGFYSFLKRSLKKGAIKQIKRGLYALVDPSTGRIYASKFQIASKLFENSYFSYHEALEYYGLATQSFVSSFTYLSNTKVNPITFEDTTYNSKVNPCPLEIKDCMKECCIRTVSLERAIIDSIDNLSLSGGLEEVEEAIKSCISLDESRLLRVLEFYDKAVLYQKVGYLLEKHMSQKIPACFFDICLSKISKKKVYLNARPGKTKLISKWNILIERKQAMPNEIF